MIIQCPSCHFERDVPETSIQPGKTYKVTCPRCSATFHFSLNTPEEKTEDSVQPMASAQTSSPDIPPSRQQSLETGAAPHLPTEQEGDDPLPPGASIPQISHKEDSPLSDQEKDKKENPVQHTGLLETLQKIRKQGTAPDSKSPGRDIPEHDGRPEGAPWENPEYHGFWGSFSRTLLGVLFHAPDFFRHVRCPLSPVRPILFYVLLSLFQMLASRLWSIKALREISATATDPQTLAMAENLMHTMNMPLMLLVTPFFSIFQAVLLAGLYHFMIRVVQPDRADFATTLRVVCYSSATLILCIVPLFGSLIASLWFVASTFMGCKYALGLPWTRTLLALLPLYILELAFVSQIPALMSSMAG